MRCVGYREPCLAVYPCPSLSLVMAEFAPNMRVRPFASALLLPLAERMHALWLNVMSGQVNTHLKKHPDDDPYQNFFMIEGDHFLVLDNRFRALPDNPQRSVCLRAL